MPEVRKQLGEKDGKKQQQKSLSVHVTRFLMDERAAMA
jgi:hypothetical protein